MPEQLPNCSTALISNQPTFKWPVPAFAMGRYIVKRYTETDKYKCAILVSKTCSNRENEKDKFVLEFNFT